LRARTVLRLLCRISSLHFLIRANNHNKPTLIPSPGHVAAFARAIMLFHNNEGPERGLREDVPYCSSLDASGFLCDIMRHITNGYGRGRHVSQKAEVGHVEGRG
jgi:hypothetical protein